MRSWQSGRSLGAHDLIDCRAARNGDRRGPRKTPTNRMVSLRVAPEVLEAYRATVKGWQVLMHATLAAHAPRQSRSTVVRRVATASSRAKKRTRGRG